MIKLGCCLPGGNFLPDTPCDTPGYEALQIIAKCRYILDCGFDFNEFNATALCQFSDEDFQLLVEENKKQPLKLQALNGMFSAAFHLADPNDQWDEIVSYIHKLIDRMAMLNIPYVVFGSGRARAIPDTMQKQDAIDNIHRMMHAFADYAEPKGITMVLEPLRKQESNVYNLVSDSGKDVYAVNRKAIRLLADSYHMVYEDTPAEIVEDFPDILRHCHIAEGPDRTPPGIFTTGDPDYNKRFANSLKKIGYTEGVSIECGFSDFKAEAPKALSYMRSIFAE